MFLRLPKELTMKFEVRFYFSYFTLLTLLFQFLRQDAHETDYK